ncbi:pyroglutamyl-peptidase I [Streptomyces sp. NPDC048636]|uniref:pyroglutamyl-peptidase I n=1 Tax=Streptomyces sp. NPDC048636 TaxID=3155762 RepID=UPI00343F4A33
MTRVLLTGFEPFGGEETNPSWEAVSLVAAAPPPGLDLTPVRLSCVFGTALEELAAAVEAADPALVLCVGQAGGRSQVTVERVAVNVDDARIPDNAGQRPIDEPVVPGGPTAYLAPLPVKACVAAVRAAGIPAAVSQTAGTFVCNHVFYGLAHLIATRRPTTRGGFVHLPCAPEQVVDRDQPSLPVATAAEALRAILTAAVHTGTDLRIAEGATH